MQKKKDFLDKIVKNDYNNDLEKILEKKYFDENVKSILLSILYKIETSYKDYKKVKQNVQSKKELIQNIIENIKNNCDEIKLINPSSKDKEILENKTFIVEKNKKRIICYNIERKLLYCISKISKKDTIIKEQYFLINKTLSDLINVGSNINTCEIIRDFNGYSWTTIPKEIESIEHNLIYQNLIILIGNEFLNKWIANREFLMDYMEKFKKKMNKEYGKENAKEFIEGIEKISVLLSAKFDKKTKEQMLKTKNEVEDKLEQIDDREVFIESITKKKRKLTKEIKKLDETVNDKVMLKKEYEIRNEVLPLEKKIFSIRILSKILKDEREQKIVELEKLNELLNPQKFVKYKKDLENKQRYLKVLNTKKLKLDIEKIKGEIQKSFLKCFEIKLSKTENKQQLMNLIYEFRYYCMLPYTYKYKIIDERKLEKHIEIIEKQLLNQAHERKIIQRFSKKDEIDYKLLRYIFKARSINLEDIYIKLIKENEKYYIEVYEGNSFEEKLEIGYIKEIPKKNFEIRVNKKVKAFY